MKWTQNEAWRVGMALRDAQSAFGSGDPDGADVVAETMKKMFDIERRQIVRGFSPANHKSAFLFSIVHNAEERAEAAKQRLSEINAGESPEVVLGVQMVVMAAEIATQEAVYSVFRQCLVGTYQNRDWKILLQMAQGKRGIARQLARQYHMTANAIRDRNELQCSAIWTRVKKLADQGVVLREAA